MPILLNIGCGDDIRQGYDNIDIRKLPGAIQGDMRSLNYTPESVIEIIASDVLEHVSFNETVDILTHWVSLLKPNGKLYLRGPNLEVIAQLALLSRSVEEVEDVIKKFFGNQDYPENFHYTIFHPKLMETYLRKAGISGEIKMYEEGTNLVIEAHK